MRIYKIFGILLSAALFTAGTSPAMAGNDAWKKKHPRRAEVLKRDAHLHNQTLGAESSGKITQKQGDRLVKQEGAIHAQEKADAAANGGKITKGEQRDLNREENKVKRTLNRDEKRNAANPGSGATAPVVPAPTPAAPAGN